MARVVVTTFGSWGDLFPMLPVAQRLRERGHDVRFAVTPAGRDLVEAEGFEHVPTGPLLGADEYSRHPEILDSRLRGVAGLIRLLRTFGLPSLEPTVKDLLRACDGADVLVTHPVQLAGPIAAEKLGMAWVTLSMFPSLVPTAHVLPQPLGSRAVSSGAGRAVARSAWGVLRETGRRLFDGPVNEVRAAFGLAPVRDAVLMSAASPHGTILLTSRHYTPRPGDWPAPVEVAGFTAWDSPSAWRSPRDVDEFLADGPPPVIVTLGASVSIDPGAFFAIAARAVAAAGARPLQLVGHERNLALVDGPAWTYVPLSKVLPHARAVVHHGGFGTTSACLVHGVPSVVIPRAFDQFHHADRLRALGLGRSVPWRRLSERSVRDALRALLDDPGYRERARAMAERIATEDGPANAAGAVERAIGPAVPVPAIAGERPA